MLYVLYTVWYGVYDVLCLCVSDEPAAPEPPANEEPAPAKQGTYIIQYLVYNPGGE